MPMSSHIAKLHVCGRRLIMLLSNSTGALPTSTSGHAGMPNLETFNSVLGTFLLVFLTNGNSAICHFRCPSLNLYISLPKLHHTLCRCLPGWCYTSHCERCRPRRRHEHEWQLQMPPLAVPKRSMISMNISRHDTRGADDCPF